VLEGQERLFIFVSFFNLILLTVCLEGEWNDKVSA